MAGRNALEKGGERGGERRGRVALDQDHVGTHAAQERREAVENAGGDARRRLPGHHEIEVDVGLEIEDFEHLVEHRPVLGGDADQALEPVGRGRGARARRVPS